MFPSVQSVRLSPRTGRTPSWRPLPGTDAGVAVRPDLCPGRTAEPYRYLSLCFIFKSHEYYVGVMEKRKFFYHNIEKIRLYYHVSNFAINQPMLPVISDPGRYLCIFCSLRLQCRATAEPMGDGLRQMDDDRAPKVVILTHDGRALPEITIYKKTAGPARQPTGLRCLIKTDAVLGRPYPPCPERTRL